MTKLRVGMRMKNLKTGDTGRIATLKNRNGDIEVRADEGMDLGPFGFAPISWCYSEVDSLRQHWVASDKG